MSQQAALEGLEVSFCRWKSNGRKKTAVISRSFGGADSFLGVAWMLGKNDGRVTIVCAIFSSEGHGHGYFVLQYKGKMICSIYDKINGLQHNDKIRDYSRWD